ncbi:hypothetical protein BDZ97DRAFT_1751434 [Flammula alnicola]|nr:hypothetical protein BDZ97DRAFT_1751434 [Flammula alnicola]
MPPKSTTASPATATNAFESLWKAYHDNTSDRLKFIDSFLFFLMLSGIAQFAIAFWSATSLTTPSWLDSRALSDSLSWQRHYARKGVQEVSPERVHGRAFADFALGSIVLHFFVYNFLG